MRTTCRRVFIIGMHNSKLTYQDMELGVNFGTTNRICWRRCTKSLLALRLPELWSSYPRVVGRPASPENCYQAV